MTERQEYADAEKAAHDNAGAQKLHGVALALAVDLDGPLVGVIVLGPSGSGKSLLALNAVNACPYRRTRLVADDVVHLRVDRGRIVARAPSRLSGLIEVRGLGPTPIVMTPETSVLLAVDLSAPTTRVPEPGLFHPLAQAAPTPLYPFKVDAPAAGARLVALARSILVDKIDDAGRNTRF
ncbi:MAG: aldolase [Pseudomonadota bacterium]